MTDIQKFYADAGRIKKHNRAENGGAYDSLRATESIIELFVSNNPSMRSLAESFADYWKKTFVDGSADAENEPSAENIEKLGALQSLLDGERDGIERFSASDFKALCELVNYEAEELPIDILEKMMMVFVEKQAV